jgi:TPR repeat protein
MTHLLNRLAVALGLALLLVPGAALAQSNVQDQLNRAKAALHGGRYADARAGFERLAQQGNPDAQFYLGRMAAGGMGVPKDIARAISWYQVAAQQGHTEAQARLGAHHFLGDGVPQSYVEAVRWSRLAAEKGHGGAAYNLAKIYRKGGEGVPADQAEATKWGKLAMAKSFPDPLKDAPAGPTHTAEALAILKEGQQYYKAGDMARAAQVFRRCADMRPVSFSSPGTTTPARGSPAAMPRPYAGTTRPRSRSTAPPSSTSATCTSSGVA